MMATTLMKQNWPNAERSEGRTMNDQSKETPNRPFAAAIGWAAGRCAKCGLEKDHLMFKSASGRPCAETECPVNMNVKRPNAKLSQAGPASNETK